MTDKDLSLKRGFKDGQPHVELLRDFVLATPEEGKEARKSKMPALA